MPVSAVRSVESPTLVLWGDRDQLVAPQQGERLTELLRDGRLELIEGSGHNPAEEHPQEVAQQLEDHL